MADGLIFGALWLIFSGFTEWIVTKFASDPYYLVASNLAAVGQDAFNFITLVVVPVFVFVVLMIVYSMVRFRPRRGEQGDAPNQKRFNPTFVWGWILVSAIINVFLWVHPTVSGLETIWAAQRPAGQTPLVVNVEARQWEWLFSYPQYGIHQALDANGQDTLELPVNRPVKFVLTSGDPFHRYDGAVAVIHSFWVPAFGIKWDVIPGETRTIVITPTVLGSTATNPRLRVQCAEVCGAGHPYMISDLKVVTPAQFDQWVKWEKSQGN